MNEKYERMLKNTVPSLVSILLRDGKLMEKRCEEKKGKLEMECISFLIKKIEEKR